MVYAYARVSAADQNLDRQIDSFIEFGVDRKRIFTDKKSGKNFDRSGYNKLIKKVRKGDLIVIKSIDRLGRNYDMIKNEWARITKLGVDILVMDMPLLDTRSRGDDVTGKLISDIVLQLLSYVAQKERENIKARQKEGIASAQSRGVKFGRPSADLPDNFTDCVSAFISKRISIHDALKITGMKRSTFYRKVQFPYKIFKGFVY